MVTIARSIVSIIRYVVAIVGGEIPTKFPGVSIVGANMELLCRHVANIGEFMQQSLLSDNLLTFHKMTSI